MTRPGNRSEVRGGSPSRVVRTGRIFALTGALLAIASTIGVIATVLDSRIDPAPMGFYGLLAGSLVLGVIYAFFAARSLGRSRIGSDLFLTAAAGWVSLLLALGRYDIYDWFQSITGDREYGYHLWIPTVGVLAIAMLLAGSVILVLGLLRQRPSGSRPSGFGLLLGLVALGSLLLAIAAAGTLNGLSGWYGDLWQTDLTPRGLHIIMGVGIGVSLLAATTAIATMASSNGGRLVPLVLLLAGWSLPLAGLARTEIYEFYISTFGDFDALGPAWTRPVSLLAMLLLAVGSVLLVANQAKRLSVTPTAPVPPPPPPAPPRPPQGRPLSEQPTRRLDQPDDFDVTIKPKKKPADDDFEVTIKRPSNGSETAK